MTKEEIKALIASQFTGQGNQIGIGEGGLEKVLNAIVDALPGAGTQALPVLEVTPFDQDDVTTEAELLAKFKLNGEAISSIEDLFALAGTTFIIKHEDYYGYPCLSLNEHSDSGKALTIIAGTNYKDYGVFEIFISEIEYSASYVNFRTSPIN